MQDRVFAGAKGQAVSGVMRLSTIRLNRTGEPPGIILK